MSKKINLKNISLEEQLKNLGVNLFEDKKDSFNIHSISTGSYFLNTALNTGGWPIGKIIEIFGTDSSGKTTLALHSVAEAQKLKKKCVYIDLENTLNFNWAKNLNVNIKDLYICKPENGELAFDTINQLVKTNKIDLIIVDSVAAMVPSVEFVNNMDDQTIGLHARLMSKGLRILQSNLINSKTTIIFINQIRDKVSSSFIPLTTTTGGRTLRYAASVRVEIKKCEAIKQNDKFIGFVTKAIVVKNKFGSPMKTAFMGLYFDSGFDYYYEIINAALDKKILVKNASWFSYKENNVGQGINGTRDALKKNEKLFKEIEKLII